MIVIDMTKDELLDIINQAINKAYQKGLDTALEDDALPTTKECADYLGISRDTFKKRALAGEYRGCVSIVGNHIASRKSLLRKFK